MALPAFRRRRTQLAAVLSSAVVFWFALAVWPARQLHPFLLSLGVDEQRVLVVIAIIAAGLAALVAGVVVDSIVLAWAAASAWFILFFELPTALSAGPSPLPGESVAWFPFAVALLALACAGCAASGAGAAIGFGARRLAFAALVARRSPTRRTGAIAIAAVVLSALSIFGAVRLPNLLLYGPWSGTVTASRPVPHGVQLKFVYFSRAFGTERSAMVVLPPEYAANPGLAFPALYLLHGSPGTDTDWLRAGSSTIVGEARIAGRLPPTVLVYPDGSGPRGGAMDHWADGYVPGDRMESDLIDDLIPSVESHFRIVPDRGHRAVGGLSAGGYGAANLALRHPDLFVVSFVFSGDLAPDATAFGANETQQVANDPLREALAPRPDDAAAFFVGWGANDDLAPGNKVFAGRLQDSGYVVMSKEVAGAHTWDVFRELLLAALDAMGERIGVPVVD